MKKNEEGCKLDRGRGGKREEVETNEMLKKTRDEKSGRKSRYIRSKEQLIGKKWRNLQKKEHVQVK